MLYCFRAVAVLLVFFMLNDMYLFFRQAVLTKQDNVCLQVLKKANRTTLDFYGFPNPRKINLRAYPFAQNTYIQFPQGCRYLINLVEAQKPINEDEIYQRYPHGSAWPGGL